MGLRGPWRGGKDQGRVMRSMVGEKGHGKGGEVQGRVKRVMEG